MLRITKVDESPSQITMKLEGKLASDWVPLLESECLRCLQEKREVLLDFSDLTFIDGRGVELLGRMAAENIKVVDCSAFIKDLLEGREKK